MQSKSFEEMMKIAYGVSLVPEHEVVESVSPSQSRVSQPVPTWFGDVCVMMVASIIACLWFDQLMWGTRYAISSWIDLLLYLLLPGLLVGWILKKTTLKKYQLSLHQWLIPGIFVWFMSVFILYTYTVFQI